jgi:hypothetical protein
MTVLFGDPPRISRHGTTRRPRPAWSLRRCLQRPVGRSWWLMTEHPGRPLRRRQRLRSKPALHSGFPSRRTARLAGLTPLPAAGPVRSRQPAALHQGLTNGDRNASQASQPGH